MTQDEKAHHAIISLRRLLQATVDFLHRTDIAQGGGGSTRDDIEEAYVLICEVRNLFQLRPSPGRMHRSSAEAMHARCREYVDQVGSAFSEDLCAALASIYRESDIKELKYLLRKLQDLAHLYADYFAHQELPPYFIIYDELKEFRGHGTHKQ